MRFILTLAAIVISSCSAIESKPNTDTAFEKVKSQKFNALRSGDIFEVIKFDKTNGENLTVFGQDVYRFQYSMTVKFKLNAHSLFRDDLKNLITDGELREEANDHKYNFDINNYYHYKSGQLKEVKGWVEFKKTENGWQ